MSSRLQRDYGLGPAFAAAWKRQWGSDLADLLVAEEGSKERLWADFTLSAYLRGRDTALDIAARLSRGIPSLDDRRALDIGCGVGGAAVALAEMGASTTAIDLNPIHTDLTQAGAADHGVELAVSAADILDAEARRPLGRFDAIVAEDVLEHVADARTAVGVIADLLTDGGLAQVTIPNGDAAQLVVADGHYLLPGLTLLRDRSEAKAYFDARLGAELEYDVGNYHSYQEYSAWFVEAGLDIADVQAIDVVGGRELTAELDKARDVVAGAAADMAGPIGDSLVAGWAAYEERVAATQSMSQQEAAMSVGASAWRFNVTKGPIERRWSLLPRRRYPWRAALKRVPGLVPLVRAIRR